MTENTESQPKPAKTSVVEKLWHFPKSCAAGCGVIVLILLVVTILGFATGMFGRLANTIIGMTAHAESARIGGAVGDIGAFNSALSLYQVDVDGTCYPVVSLGQLVSDNTHGWSGPYMATITADPWGNDYSYTSNGATYTVQSLHVSNRHRSETIRYCIATGLLESIP